MKELAIDNFDVVELNADEQQHTEGGNPWVWVGIGWAVGHALDYHLAKMYPVGGGFQPSGGGGPVCDNV